mmetsp:Transcript_97593/g.276079  ORF Transcript_97593/g.276079 Transcript_97593/m.276079 type:complete len:349 (-) Transcript_97593:110-1156(-)
MEAEAPSQQRYTYDAPWPTYALAWSARQESRCRLALGSCMENEANHIRILELSEDQRRLETVAEVEQPFPPTRLMFRPEEPEGARGGKPDLLAAASTTVDLWKIEDGQMRLAAKLANTRSTQSNGHQPPITSFDWSTVSHHKLGCSSVDTTCTIWNLEKSKIETQLIAHDKAVYDIAFSQVDSLFASVGADGSVRLFDQRNLESSTIIYEASPPSPLLRLAWNKINTNHIATIALDIPGVILIDIRRPSTALAALNYQDACVNTITWAPHSRNHLLCGTDDGNSLIWDVKETPAKQDTAVDVASARPRPKMPVQTYETGREIYQVQWPASQPDHIALGMARRIEVVQV